MTYEYKCTKCKAEWELEQKITEDALKICPYCGKEAAKRLISNGGGFRLKGGGWANTGYS